MKQFIVALLIVNGFYCTQELKLTIKGKINDSITSAGIPNVMVRALSEGTAWFSTSSELGNGSSDTNGNYSFDCINKSSGYQFPQYFKVSFTHTLYNYYVEGVNITDDQSKNGGEITLNTSLSPRP